MVEPGWGKIERPIEQKLSGCGFEEIFATDDLRDFHRGIVNNHRQLIRRNVIVAPHNKIAEIFAGDELLGTAVGIGKGNDFAIRDQEAPVDL